MKPFRVQFRQCSSGHAAVNEFCVVFFKRPCYFCTELAHQWFTLQYFQAAAFLIHVSRLAEAPRLENARMRLNAIKWIDVCRRQS